MQIYIDESGNLGKKKRFFIIAALTPEKSRRIINIIKRYCIKLGKPNDALDEIKGPILNFPNKQKILQNFNKKDDFHCHYIAADKKHIKPELLKDNNLCFNYLMSYLLKPIFRGAIDDIQIIIDNRSVKVASKHSLQDYIKLKALMEWGVNKKITFQYIDSRDSKNLQAIHIIANVVYGKYNYGKNHLYNIIANKFIHIIEFPQSKFGK